jgi:hypothetical protein
MYLMLNYFSVYTLPKGHRPPRTRPNDVGLSPTSHEDAYDEPTRGLDPGCLFPALIDELELRYPGLTSIIGDIAIIDALNAIQERNVPHGPRR